MEYTKQYILIAKPQGYGDLMIAWKLNTLGKNSEMLEHLKNKTDTLLMPIETWNEYSNNAQKKNINVDDIWKTRKIILLPAKN